MSRLFLFCSGSGARQAVACSLLLAACSTEQTIDNSAWPPPDFLLDVESSRGTAPAQEVRRFQAWPDGFTLYRHSQEALATADGQLVLPIYSTCCAYLMRPVAIRLLARKTAQRAANVNPEPGADASTLPQERPTEYGQDRPSQRLRFLCRAMGTTHAGIAEGPSFSGIASVLSIVNQYVPPGEEFRLPGTTLAPGGNMLVDVPRPRRSLTDSLHFHLQLLARFPADADLVRDTFALACKASDRATAEAMLERYRRLKAATPEQRPLVPGEPLTLPAEALAQFLPPG